MKMSGLLSRRSHDLPGVAGTVRRIAPGGDAPKRLGSKDIVFTDLNRTSADTARAIVNAAVVAVVHTPQPGEGMLPRTAYRVLAASAVPVIEDIDSAAASSLSEGSRIRLDDGVLFTGSEEIASGRNVAPAVLLGEVDASETAYVDSALAHMANATEFLSLEHQLLLDGEGVPEIDTSIRDRHVLIVTGEAGSKEQLAELKPFIKEYRPVLIGVGAGADLLRSAKHGADLIVARPTDVSEEVLTSGGQLIVPADRDGRCEGLERVTEMGIGATTFPAAATARDMALLIAHHRGAAMIVVTGDDSGLEGAFSRNSSPSATIVNRLVSTKLVHAEACSSLYRSRGAGVGLALVILAALVAVATVVVARGAAQEVLVWIVETWNTFALWVQGLFT